MWPVNTPVAARTTVAPGMAFPQASRVVTVIVEVPLPAEIVFGLALTLDSVALNALGATVTATVCVMVVPLIVAEIVLVPATVELRVPVATPLALVALAGGVKVLLDPVAARTTIAPWMAFPKPSRAVTVIVEVPQLTGIVVGERARIKGCVKERRRTFPLRVHQRLPG